MLSSTLLNSPLHIDLPAAGLRCGEVGCRTIKEHILKQGSIHALTLMGSPLNTNALQEINEALSSVARKELRYLDLSSCQLRFAKNFEALCASLSVMPLEHLDFEENKLDDASAPAVGRLLAQIPRLKALSLSGNNFSAEAMCRLLEDLLRGLNAVESLESIVLSGLPLNADACMALGTFVASATHLRTLELADCGITEEFSQYIADGVAQSCSLEELNLSQNDCISAFAVPVESQLYFPATLRTLNLSGNCIRSAHEANGLALALSGTTNLEELVLSNTELADIGLASFYAAVQRSPRSLQRLHSLDLSNASITGSAGPFMERLLTHCRSLKTLRLNDNEFGESGANALASVFDRSKSEQLSFTDGCTCTTPWATTNGSDAALQAGASQTSNESSRASHVGVKPSNSRAPTPMCNVTHPASPHQQNCCAAASAANVNFPALLTPQRYDEPYWKTVEPCFGFASGASGGTSARGSNSIISENSSEMSSQLQSLNLSNCALGDGGVEKIVIALTSVNHSTTEMQELSVDRSQFSARYNDARRQLTTEFCTPVSHHNNNSYSSPSPMMHTAISPSTVRQILLSGNDLTDAGCAQLCQNLLRLPAHSLTDLDLSHNALTEQSKEMLEQVLAHHRNSLRVVAVRGNTQWSACPHHISIPAN